MLHIHRTCDHCGKQLNSMHDYTEISIDPGGICYIDADLCRECMNDLVKQICEFVKQDYKELCRD